MLELILLFFLVVCALAAVQMKDLLSSIMLLTIYSLIMAIVWMSLNAVDVAFTEASVGAGITTVLLMAALSRTSREESNRKVSLSVRAPSLLVLFLVTAVLLYGTVDMPAFGDPEAPANLHVAPEYIKHAVHETGVSNFVTSILAAYRGYDTLGEVVVVFTAGACVIMILRKIN
jgi:multicomponent Na+:H+ antiporter subunit B